MSQFDIACIGGAKLDIFLSLHNANNYLHYQKDTNELCIKFGQKIPVDKAEVFLGGNATNVSVGLSRLGLNVGIIAEIGKDEFAQKIINYLKAENVNTSKIVQEENTSSSFSVILSYANDRTIFSQHIKRNHNFNLDDIETKWIYLTSIGAVWENVYDKTVEYIKKTGASLVFNPGTLQVSDANNLLNVLAATHILIVNREEAEQILKTKDEILMIEDLLKKLKQLGPKIVVITDGKNGSYAINEQREILKQDIIESKAVEITGAGDAYSSGFVAGFIKTNNLQQAMHLGALNSSSCIKIRGAQNGLLYEKDIVKYV